MENNKKAIETRQHIRQFLIDCGFLPLHNGVPLQEYIKPIMGDRKYAYQINGVDVSDIETLNETVYFSENGIDPFDTPMYRYSVGYPNLKAMVEVESKRGIDFSIGLEKWIIK